MTTKIVVNCETGEQSIIEMTVDEIASFLPPILTIEQKREQLAPLTAWQIRKVLTKTGLRKQVEDAVLGADQNTQDAWNYADSFNRDDATLMAMAKSLGMTDAQVDNIFVIGATL